MLTEEQGVELLKMIWPHQAGRTFPGDCGGVVEIVRTGEYDPTDGRFAGAEVCVDGAAHRGAVVVGGGDATVPGSCILQVVANGAAPRVAEDDGTFLPRIVLTAGPVTETAYAMLCDGATGYGCAATIRRMEDHRRVAMFTRLVADRLQRKCGDLRAIYERCEQSWHETMYVMLMRTMGDHRNREAFTELAGRVRHTFISRERNQPEYVEAMLLGTSGLLDLYDDDRYIRTLKEHYEYLRRKYGLQAMMAGQWTISQTNPANHPVLRIAQMAAFLTAREFLFDNLVRCRTVEDVQTLFRAQASDYWSTHYIPSRPSDSRPKRIGHFKANMLGINLVVPMIFAYGDYMRDETSKDAAIDLLEKIVCEDNSIVNGWRSGGVTMENAFDSQAILQLNNEYCLRNLCHQCPVGRAVIRRTYLDEHK